MLQVLVLLDPCCVTCNIGAVQDLQHIIKSVCTWQIPEGQPGYQEVRS